VVSRSATSIPNVRSKRLRAVPSSGRPKLATKALAPASTATIAAANPPAPAPTHTKSTARSHSSSSVVRMPYRCLDRVNRYEASRLSVAAVRWVAQLSEFASYRAPLRGPTHYIPSGCFPQHIQTVGTFAFRYIFTGRSHVTHITGRSQGWRRAAGPCPRSRFPGRTETKMAWLSDIRANSNQLEPSCGPMVRARPCRARHRWPSSPARRVPRTTGSARAAAAEAPHRRACPTRCRIRPARRACG
jgi:hypothetical protein